MNKSFIYILLIILIAIYIPIQRVYSYNDGTVNVIKETNKSKFDSMKGEEILIILDFSSSINKLGSSDSGINKVRKAVYSIVNSLPNDAKVGLRIFGPDKSGLSANSCSATNLQVPISSNGKASIINTLSGFSSYNGESPVTLALKNAIDYDFKSQNITKHIVLISASNDSCNSDPCSYINNITSRRNDIIIDVIALGSDIGSVNRLKCLSSATGGQYMPIKSTDDFTLNISTTVIYFDENKQKNNEDLIPIPQSNGSVKYYNYLFEFSI